MKKLFLSITRKLQKDDGEGEYISFAVVVTFICVLMVVAIGFSQLSSNLNKINNTLSVVARSVAVARDMEEAVSNANDIARTTIAESASISNVRVSVKLLDNTLSPDTWDAGTQVLVSLSADVKTVSPFTSGTQTRTALVSVEAIMSGLRSGMLKYKVTESGALGISYPVTSWYGNRNAPVEGASTDHKGMDFGMMAGTRLLAPANAKVVHISPNDPNRGGWVVMYIGRGYYVEYLHMSQISVHVGQSLKEGVLVGLSGGVPGTFGAGSSTGAHLHLGVLFSADGEDSILNFYDNSYRIDPYVFVMG